MAASNQKKKIVTKGSGHAAETKGATDRCWDAPKETVAPYENKNPSSNLAGGTVKTTIAGAPIWTTAGHLAAPSQPAHAGVGGGTTSGTYCSLATPVGKSSDVVCEGAFVIRSGDGTMQNACNTSGIVNEMTAAQIEQMRRELAAGRDKIVKLEGVCDHGRVLDFPRGAKRTGEPAYLEIFDTDHVTFTATRMNAVEPGGPVCAEGGIHTKWVVTWNTPDQPTLQGTWTGIDTHVVGAIPFENSCEEEEEEESSFDFDWPRPGVGYDDEARGDGFRSEEHANKPRVADPTGRPGSAKRKAQERKAQKERERNNRAADERAQRRMEADKKRRTRDSIAGHAAYAVLYDIALLWKLWNAKDNMPQIHVEATACSGSKAATLNVFPSGAYTFDLFSGAIATAVETLTNLGRFVEYSGKIFNLEVETELFAEPQLYLTVEYMELVEDGPNGLTKGCINRSWELEINFQKMFSIFIEKEFPASQCLLACPPAAVFVKMLEELGIEGAAFLNCEFMINPTLKCTWDQYDVATVTEFKVDFIIEYQLGIKFSAAFSEFGCCAYIALKVAFDDVRVSVERLMEFHSQASIQIGIKAFASADVFFFRANWEMDWAPDWLKCESPEQWLGICGITQ